MASKRKLIETKDLQKAAKLNKFGGSSVANILMILLRINKLNKLYEEIGDLEPMAFIDELIRKLHLDYEVSEEDLSRIPRQGAFITVSNHPYGGIDGLLLVKIISTIRPDIRVLVNFLMNKIEPASEFLLPVNPFENRKSAASSLAGLKMALKHLDEGNVLGLFPAGEVSSYNHDNYGKTDRQWQVPALKLIKKAQVPVVPVYFEGTNSRIFHLLGLIHPALRTVRLPSELFNKKHKKIRIRIGHPVSVKELNEFSDQDRLGRYLRAKTYALGSALEVKRFFLPRFKRAKKPESIAEEISTDKIIKEVKMLRESGDALLFSNTNFDVFCSPAENIPGIIYEIGRLREMTFRKVGEGTNRSRDLDEYDLYYQHLFVWDREENQIAGAYRIGIGDQIMQQFGVKGFYLQSLFRMQRGFRKILKQSMELGRSFVIEEYQRKPLPLFLLWKGILYFLLKNADYRYLVGPVSISSQFSEFSKSMIINFIKKYFYDKNLSKYVRPRVKYNVQGYNLDEDIIFESTDNLQKFDKFINDVETSGYKMPVLLKRYLKLNGKIIGFNVDPKFNNALDGLLILDLFEVPVETIESLSKELNDETILKRFEIGKITKGHF